MPASSEEADAGTKTEEVGVGNKVAPVPMEPSDGESAAAEGQAVVIGPKGYVADGDDGDQARVSFAYCIVLPHPLEGMAEPAGSGDAQEEEELEAVRLRLCRKLTAGGLFRRHRLSRDGDEEFIEIGIGDSLMQVLAERFDFTRQVTSENGNGFTGYVKSRAECFRKFDRVSNDGFKESFRALFTSREAAELILQYMESKEKMGGLGIDFNELAMRGLISNSFILHEEEELAEIERTLGSFKKCYRLLTPDELDTVERYFGSRVSMYFAFLCFYTRWLGGLSLVSLPVALYMMIANNYDSWLIAPYALVVTIWSTIMLVMWSRKQYALAVRWGTAGFHAGEEKPRPEFKGQWREIPGLSGEYELYYPKRARVKKIIGASLPTLVLFVVIVIGCVAGIIIFKAAFLQSASTSLGLPPNLVNVFAGASNSIAIIALGVAYEVVAGKLNDWENHRTDSMYDDALRVKTFTFQFVNCFASLFYMAYIKPTWKDADTGETVDACDLTGCMHSLSIQLMMVFFIKILASNFTELALPWMKRMFKTSWENATVKRSGQKVAPLSFIEEQNKRMGYRTKESMKDFEELAIQFGFCTLFAPSFPLAPLFGFLNNMIEVRLDMFKLASEFQRPEPKRSENIGAWGFFFVSMSNMAVVTNVCIVAFTSTYLSVQLDLDMSTILWIVIIAEHLLLMLRFMMRALLPSDNDQAKTAMRTQQRLIERFVLPSKDGSINVR